MEKSDNSAARPAELVPVAVATFEEVWRTQGRSLTLLRAIAAPALDEAETRLGGAPARPPKAALVLAWGVVEPILERLLVRHEFLPDTIKGLLKETGDAVAGVFAEG
ncbi:hypothetical protein [Actinomadura terrae]|uniref:hypothetical protein n=1 Tax=Actinomadura terrae TaxID=604353 RepID=UPI001FA7F1CB|nr:hypothetical protein [Actinomadura terrae]